jgi:hypothetical protein
MTAETEDGATRNASWGLRILAVGGWTALCVFAWFLWVGHMAVSPDLVGPGSETALGMAACLATGCIGGGWLMGLSVALVLYSLLRR